MREETFDWKEEIVGYADFTTDGEDEEEHEEEKQREFPRGYQGR